MRDKGDHYEYVGLRRRFTYSSRAPDHHHRVRDYTQVQVEGIRTYRIPFGMRLRS
jgi:hypothetical protein